MAEHTQWEAESASDAQAAPDAASAPMPMPMSEPEPVPMSEPEPEPEPISAPGEAAAGRKRTVKTRTLFTGAVVLGLVGGASAGYTVQALRTPTPLPPLSVAQPLYPLSPIYDGVRTAGLPTSQDDATVVDGDLTKLLLPTPAGATATIDHTWMDLLGEADTCDDTASCFDTDLHDGVARIADTAWMRGDGLFEEIRILQYLPGHSSYADHGLNDLLAGGGAKLSMPDGIAAAGKETFDSHHEYDDHAVSVHGDLAVYFWVTSATHVPDPSIINDLIKRQMVRL
ncbi:hypothetical protein KGA66_01960 [Actinocrinis puniceicyclus]|uniref:Uncharacterized protein n=1 Tax=Actinocrinis puniceicyclus TaxID=977794 RepID=A0A8J7WGN6_9ACTN|nr:hypothetical protein [Actinocrinis puniceicyclus]MBS2961796.1 hypothetical protein [Actinocrinis puniceicyclus]